MRRFARTVVFLLLAAAAMALATWFADRPGSVTIVWQGWRADLSVGALALAAAALAVTAILLHRFWHLIFGAPVRYVRWRRERRRRQGYAALTRGLVAVAAGDPAEARRQARRADVLLEEPPLTMLLAAQTAQLVGDEEQARRHFEAMRRRPETEFLGLRGLIVQSLKRGDRDGALPLLRRARELQPDTAWVQSTAFDLEARRGDWLAAAETLRLAARSEAIAPALAHRHEAAVMLERARVALAAKREDDALALAERAWKIAPDHPAVAELLAERYLAGDRRRAAIRVIEQAWSRLPRRALARLYARASGAATPVDALRAIERLAERAPTHPDAALALAEAALDAKLWGEARRYLQPRLATSPSTGVYRTMARIEEDERNDLAASRDWLLRASDAAPERGWICSACGHEHVAWQALCASCGAFDRLDWTPPHRADASAPLLAVPRPA
jgi:HemY protein